MCGIAGYLLKQPIHRLHPSSAGLIQGIRPRGPDDEGVCLAERRDKTLHLLSSSCVVDGAVYPRHDTALFHTRYSIIDISSAGHQPFCSRDGRCAAVFNGEIYNYIELREELIRAGVEFVTATDTEVLVEGYRRWKDDLWPKMNGFWAVVLYDLDDGSLVLSRDRLGVAPLYYRETPEGLFFASLIAPLKKVSSYPVFDEDILRHFIVAGVKDEDRRTMYEGIYSFPPASVMRLPAGRHHFSEGDIVPYWQLPDKPWSAADLSFDQAVRRWRELFFDAVRIRLRSDIQLGLELSGGLDSSSVVAAAAEITGKRLVTYTLKVEGRDEEPFARQMRQKYPLDYRVVSGLEADLHANAEMFNKVMEEPYDTPANYLHHVLLKRMKSDGVGVILTGAGGDEALAGYEASFWPSAYRQWRAEKQGRLPADWYEFCRRFRSLDQAKVTAASYMRALARHSGLIRRDRVAAGAVKADKRSFFEERRYHILKALLPYYLRSTDHYTMNIPLEHRFPFLDYRLVELGVRLPVEYLFRNGYTKYVLRRAMAPYLPSGILWRRQKFGFPFAYVNYFKGREKEWCRYVELAKGRGLMGPDVSYETLVCQQPLLLWRIISAGIWLDAEGQS